MISAGFYGGIYVMWNWSDWRIEWDRKAELNRLTEMFEDCQSDVRKKINDKYQNIDEAIDNSDFDAAHLFYSCYPNFGRELNYSNFKDVRSKLFKSEEIFLMKEGEFERALKLHVTVYGGADISDLTYSERPDFVHAEIVAEAVNYFLEKGDRPSAIKWAKRGADEEQEKALLRGHKKTLGTQKESGE
jgi:hypothetical protein